METWEESIRQGLLCLLEETLHSHQGVYLTPGTSLLETLATIDADRASRSYPGLGETIAGHVHHARFYLQNTLDMMRGTGDGTFDVAASWSVVTVTPAQWDELRAEVARVYAAVMGLVARAPVGALVEGLPAVLGLFAHTAYHLGALRQLKDLG